MKSLLFHDLTETTIGGFLVRFILPMAAIIAGTKALVSGQMNLRGAEVPGLSAYLYGTAFVVFGAAIFALPPTKSFASGHVSRLAFMRLCIGLGLFAILMGAATVSLF